MEEVTIHDDHISEELSTSNTEPSTSPGSNTTRSRGSCKLTFDKEVFKRDISTLSTYVKDELYYGVKFLYDPRKDLAVGEQIYNHFYKVCRNRLEGVKQYQSQREKDLYIRYLWKDAMDERVQQDSLSVKRSSVYTVMQNRFFVSEFAKEFDFVTLNLRQLTIVNIVPTDFV